MTNALAIEVAARVSEAEDAAAVPEREQHLQLLRDASREIRQLRQRLEIQDAKVQTMELLANLGRQHCRDYATSGGYGPDIAWLIDRALERAAAPALDTDIDAAAKAAGVKIPY